MSGCQHVCAGTPILLIYSRLVFWQTIRSTKYLGYNIRYFGYVDRFDHSSSCAINSKPWGLLCKKHAVSVKMKMFWDLEIRSSTDDVSDREKANSRLIIGNAYRILRYIDHSEWFIPRETDCSSRVLQEIGLFASKPSFKIKCTDSPFYASFRCPENASHF